MKATRWPGIRLLVAAFLVFVAASATGAPDRSTRAHSRIHPLPRNSALLRECASVGRSRLVLRGAGDGGEQNSTEDKEGARGGHGQGRPKKQHWLRSGSPPPRHSFPLSGPKMEDMLRATLAVPAGARGAHTPAALSRGGRSTGNRG